MKLSFIEEDWIPNYITFEQKEKEKLDEDEVFEDVFLNYIEAYVRAVKEENVIHFIFDFGERKIKVLCHELETMLYDLKRNEFNHLSAVNVEPKELADFLLYFGLIEATPNGYKMIEEISSKAKTTSLATLLGHILLEKHFPIEA